MIIYDNFEYVFIPSSDNMDLVQTLKNINITLFAVMAENYDVLMNDIVNHEKLNLFNTLLTNILMIR